MSAQMIRDMNHVAILTILVMLQNNPQIAMHATGPKQISKQGADLGTYMKTTKEVREVGRRLGLLGSLSALLFFTESLHNRKRHRSMRLAHLYNKINSRNYLTYIMMILHSNL
jgi:hypothetical protein